MQKILERFTDVCNKLIVFKRAVKETKKSLHVKRRTAATFDCGVAYGNMKMYREAIDSYKQALAIHPKDPKIYYNLGTMYEKTDMLKEAQESYRKAVRLKPAFAAALYNLGIVSDRLNMPDEAILNMKRLLKIKPDSFLAHLNLGVYLGKLHRFNEAKKTLAHAVHLDPDNPEAHYRLALINLQLKDRGSAIKEHRILSDLAPELAEKLSKLLPA